MKPIQTLTVHKSDVNGISFSKETLATCSSDKTVRIFALNTYNELPCSPLCDHTYAIHCVEVSPDQKLLASCSTDGRCIIWDLKKGQKLSVFKHKNGNAIRRCVFAPNGKYIATGGDDDDIYIWDINSQIAIKKLKGHEDSTSVLAFTPDSAFLVSGTPNGDMRIWDAVYAHGKELYYNPEAHDLGMTCAQVSPTYGSAGGVASSVAQQLFLLATGGFDHLVKLWELYSYTGSGVLQVRLRTKLQGHNEAVHCLCFSSDGRLLASGSGDHSIRLWNPLRGELLYTLDEAHFRYITAVAFSHDGDLLASGSNDKTVKIWNVSSDLSIGDDEVIPSKVEAVQEPQGKPQRKSITSWTVQDVAGFIEAIGMSQYASNFVSNAIDGSELPKLTQESLKKDLQIDALGHRNKILSAISQARDHPIVQRFTSVEDNTIPHEFLCPITMEIMRDPVIAADGYSYEKAAITSWLKSGKKNSPMTNAPLDNVEFTPNRSLRILIQRHLQQQ